MAVSVWPKRAGRSKRSPKVAAKKADTILGSAGGYQEASPRPWPMPPPPADALTASGSAPFEAPQHAEVYFEVVAETIFGSQVRVVGGVKALGCWQPEAGVNLTTSPQSYPLWSTSALIPAACATQTIEFKYVILTPDGCIMWEDGANRIVEPFKPKQSSVAKNRKFAGMMVSRNTPRYLPPIPACMPEPLWTGDTVTWRVVCSDTRPGDRLFVVGSSPVLGDWNATRGGLMLETCPTLFPVWYGTREMGNTRPMWKLTIIRGDGSQNWEDGQDKPLDVPIGTVGKPRGWLLHTPFNGLPQLMEVEHSESPQSPRRLAAKVNSPQTSVGSNALRDDSSISTIASDWEEDEEYATGSDSQLSTDQWRLHTGAHQLHKPGGRCEDAFFCSPRALGVADGVGQMSYFSKYGVDSAAYAVGLMDRAYAALRPGSSATKSGDGAAERAQAAIKVAESEVESYGASTICVLSLDGNVAGIANLGDSGFMLLRKSDKDGKMEVVSKSEEQQHGWNFPYQLMRIPPALEAKVPRGRRFDTADDCERYTIELMAGDLLLLYTDGLADNLHRHEILDVVNQYTSGPEHTPVGTSANAEAISRALAIKAQERSNDEGAEVPFNVCARQFGHEFTGGKADDITVVAAWVGCDLAA